MNRFVEYLKRGVWPFLIGLVMGLIAMVPLLGGFGIGFGLAQVAGPPAGVIAGLALGFVGVVLITMLSVPMTLHAELTATFDLPAAYRFAVSFWKLVGGEAIVAGIVFVPLAFLVTILGMLLCFVGVYPASILTQMAGQHLVVQLYHEYMDRGGEPILDDEPWDDRADGYDDDDRGYDRDRW